MASNTGDDVYADEDNSYEFDDAEDGAFEIQGAGSVDQFNMTPILALNDVDFPPDVNTQQDNINIATILADAQNMVNENKIKGKEVDKATQLPGDTRLIAINSGFSISNIDLKNYDATTVVHSILASGYKYIQSSTYRHKNLFVALVRHKIDIDLKSIYSRYLNQLNSKIISTNYGAYMSQVDDPQGVPLGSLLPLIIAGPENKRRCYCGCCGDEISTSSIGQHVRTKMEMYAIWTRSKWSCCPWCNIKFNNPYECAMHWFDGNHITRSCFGVIGVQESGLNDSRLHKTFPLPYTPIMQSALALYLRHAPVVIATLVQRVTQVDIANTQELATSMAIELANCCQGENWLPDCPTCDARYFQFNVVHYSSVAALCADVEYQQRPCGHIIPALTIQQLRDIPLQFFQDLADKLEGKKKRYSCSTYRTAAKKDQYDDDDQTRDTFKRMITLSVNTETSAERSMEFINVIEKGPTQQQLRMLELHATYDRYYFMNNRILPFVDWPRAAPEEYEAPVVEMAKLIIKNEPVKKNNKRQYNTTITDNRTIMLNKNKDKAAYNVNRIIPFNNKQYAKACRYNVPIDAPFYRAVITTRDMCEYRVPMYYNKSVHEINHPNALAHFYQIAVT